MLIDRSDSALLLIDVQEKLTPLVQDYQKMVSNCAWLLKAARQLNVPMLVSEQYVQGLGSTVPELKEFADNNSEYSKVHFSCAADRYYADKIDALSKTQWILIGIETHVCVMQTALDLLYEDKDVYVVADATSSRDDFDKQLAIERMRAEGIFIVSKEMVLFEWLKKAGTDEFKQMSKAFLR